MKTSSFFLSVAGIIAALSGAASLAKADQTTTLTCSSAQGSSNRCYVDGFITSVTILRDYNNNCFRGNTYDEGDDNIFVSGGCKVDVRISYKSKPAHTVERTTDLTCSSSQGTSNRCYVAGHITKVTILHDHFGNCFRGNTYAEDDDNVYVSSGCTIDLRITYEAAN